MLLPSVSNGREAATIAHSVLQTDAEWEPRVNTCTTSGTARTLPTLATTLGVDFALLLLMLVGLMRDRDAIRYGICGFLWKQVRPPKALIRDVVDDGGTGPDMVGTRRHSGGTRCGKS